MPDVVIRHRAVEPDPWKYLGLADAGEALGRPYPEGPIAVPLATWKADRAELARRPWPAGVWLRPDDDPRELAADFAKLALVAIHFPRFADGRGYSTAFLLRQRLGYRGELRAFGDVGRDQIFYLSRVGFDAFRLADHRDADSALAAFNDFSVRYQGTVDQPLPLFRRREVVSAVPKPGG